MFLIHEDHCTFLNPGTGSIHQCFSLSALAQLQVDRLQLHTFGFSDVFHGFLEPLLIYNLCCWLPSDSGLCCCLSSRISIEFYCHLWSLMGLTEHKNELGCQHFRIFGTQERLAVDSGLVYKSTRWSFSGLCEIFLKGGKQIRWFVFNVLSCCAC